MDDKKLAALVDDALSNLLGADYAEQSQILVQTAYINDACSRLRYAFRDAYEAGQRDAQAKTQKQFGELAGLVDRVAALEQEAQSETYRRVGDDL